jgi:hypothetical protein
LVFPQKIKGYPDIIQVMMTIWVAKIKATRGYPISTKPNKTPIFRIFEKKIKFWWSVS